MLPYGTVFQIFNVYCNVLHITAIEMLEHVPECDPPVVTCGQCPPQPNLIICIRYITPTPNGQQDRSSDVRMITTNALMPRWCACNCSLENITVNRQMEGVGWEGIMRTGRGSLLPAASDGIMGCQVTVNARKAPQKWMTGLQLLGQPAGIIVYINYFPKPEIAKGFGYHGERLHQRQGTWAVVQGWETSHVQIRKLHLHHNAMPDQAQHFSRQTLTHLYQYHTPVRACSSCERLQADQTGRRAYIEILHAARMWSRSGWWVTCQGSK